jgi:bifunctional DNase/RNase
MEKITSQVAIGLYNAMPLVEGTIIAVEEGELYIDIGANVGLKKGTKCIAFSEGEPIKHPVTGEVMGKRNKKLAELVLVQVQDRMAIAKYIQNEKGTAGIGDKVVVK